MSAVREGVQDVLQFNVCVLGRLTMFFKRERKQIRFGERRKVTFHLFNKYLLSTYYVPGLFWGDESYL